MDWFERITGFRETDYPATKRRLWVDGGRLFSDATTVSWGVGRLTLPSLAQLRTRIEATTAPRGRIKVRCISGEAGMLHVYPEYAGALFQVASQFNLLEMMAPGVTPEHGVTRYQADETQGPACAIAAGAATIYRNYLVPVGRQEGQTAERQIDCLAALGAALSQRIGRPVADLWEMRNGYALCRGDGLTAIARYLGEAGEDELDRVRGVLAIGLHSDVEVTEAALPAPRTVSQAFCSALPVSYSYLGSAEWPPFAGLVLDAAYEATLWAAVQNAARGASNVVLLTRLGGGAFGNSDAWIDHAIVRALRLARGFDLDVRLVSFMEHHPSMLAIEKAFA